MIRKILFVVLTFLSFNVNASDKKDLDKSAYLKAVKIAETCEEEAFKDKPTTTLDMRTASYQTNNCIETFIKEEMQKGFDKEELQKMNDYLTNVRKNSNNFYWMVYNENKYCKGSCGTIAQLFNTADVREVLVKMLAKLIFLNENKNGY